MAKSPFVITVKGDFKKTLNFLKKLENGDFYKVLESYGKQGVDSLRDYTPVDSGGTADQWFYEVDMNEDRATITWCNSNVHDGLNVVVLLEYGHGTRFGGYVEGVDIVDPALEPIFNDMIRKIWKEVCR